MRKRWKVVLGIAGTLVVGALGNGLWELVFAPGGAFVLNGILSAITFGVEAARDSVYRTAAFGFIETPSRHLLRMLVLLLFGVPAGYVGLRRGMAAGRKEARRLNQLIEDEFRPGEKISEERLPQEVRDARAHAEASLFDDRAFQFFVVATMLCGSFLAVGMVQDLYSGTVVAHYRKALTVISPHISAEERILFEARFAKIGGRADFVALFNELNGIAEQHGEKKDDFSPW